ncbi:MAG TPA: low affinity iron permease family protein [Thermoanaerobaculia bacterium]
MNQEARDNHEGQRNRISQSLASFAAMVSRWAGSNWGFGTAVTVILVWAALGPLFGFSNTWQLIVNTGTTIVTFLMVFLIQRAQNKDGLAMQLKLNELVAAVEGASNRLIDVEDLTEEDLETLRDHYRRLVEMSKQDHTISMSHSIEEAESRHLHKRDRRTRQRAS